VVIIYCNAVKSYYENLTGKELYTIIEFGSAGGWFTKYFQDYFDVEIKAIEPTENGHNKCKERGIKNVLWEDIRIINRMYEPSANHQFFRKYNVALCTEVAEHIEPFFACNVVHNLIVNSDFIWWSSAEPGAKPHLHHPNEQPLKYWINLFDFYGFGCYMLPDEVFNACQGRGRCIFFNKQTYPHLL